jgi:ABC-type polysaccharide/polyol phosphate transport system ATPase subunit
MQIVSVKDVSKRYRIGKPVASLKETAVGWLSGRAADQWLWALRDVNVSVSAGESVGIIGHNGAGKSTLLRMLARVSKPTTGKIEIHGRMAALLDLGAGFHPDLTGRENVFLNGTLLGLKRSRIRKQFDEIVAFSEVERFIDTPVKHYSSGMTLRLSFAIAAHLDCDVLLIDEVLSVGDQSFKEKCLQRMRRLSDQGMTIILTSHNFETVNTFCARALLFHGGCLVADGKPQEILPLYRGREKRPVSIPSAASDADSRATIVI